KVTGRNPSSITTGDGGGPDHPVAEVTEDEAVKFCEKLSALPAEKSAGRHYRLPSHDEWEYACRAGAQTAYSFGTNAERASDLAWHAGNSPGKTQPVGRKLPNAWGLYDMHGNVFELVADVEFCRGGSYKHNDITTLRSAFRIDIQPNGRYPDLGF